MVDRPQFCCTAARLMAGRAACLHFEYCFALWDRTLCDSIQPAAPSIDRCPVLSSAKRTIRSWRKGCPAQTA